MKEFKQILAQAAAAEYFYDLSYVTYGKKIMDTAYLLAFTDYFYTSEQAGGLRETREMPPEGSPEYHIADMMSLSQQLYFELDHRRLEIKAGIYDESHGPHTLEELWTAQEGFMGDFDEDYY